MPDLLTLQAASQATQKKLQDGAAANWTTIITKPGGAPITINVIREGDRFSYSFRIPDGSSTTEVTRVVQRDGVWYVTDLDQRGKYRPYECPFQIPSIAVLLPRANFLTVDRPTEKPLGDLQGVSNNIATFHKPLPSATRVALQGAKKQGLDRLAADPANPKAGALRQQIAQIDELLKNGFTYRVDLSNGIIIDFSDAQMQLQVRDFHWLSVAPPATWVVASGRWPDYTAPPLPNDRSQFALILGNASWRPGLGSDYDLKLLDLNTGDFRRVPYHGESAMDGAFFDNRSKVVVTALDAMAGTSGVYTIDLATGENRPLVTGAISDALFYDPAVSPDGKSVAVTRTVPGGDLLKHQVVIIDLATGQSHDVGRPGDYAFLSWRRDGKGLIMHRIEPGSPNQITPRNIVSLDLQGTLAVLHRGDTPTVLGDGRILFQDDTDNLWKTCDVQGRNPQVFADGLAKHLFASAGPDGAHILFIRKEDNQTMQPVIVDLQGHENLVPVPAALWTNPSWE
ncbi:MAG TPA: hypothetical protein VHC95_07170 [Opitutales bacterium]|nr:hypothetical protein [Opitutales bacterium]